MKDLVNEQIPVLRRDRSKPQDSCLLRQHSRDLEKTRDSSARSPGGQQLKKRANVFVCTLVLVPYPGLPSLTSLLLQTEATQRRSQEHTAYLVEVCKDTRARLVYGTNDCTPCVRELA